MTESSGLLFRVIERPSTLSAEPLAGSIGKTARVPVDAATNGADVLALVTLDLAPAEFAVRDELRVEVGLLRG